ncbi:DUF3560 domain-containing protein [Xanthomonas citri]|nr:DUF3560 domain-containing protein [Xanthomonas citri]
MQDRNQQHEQEPAKTSNEIRQESHAVERTASPDGSLTATYSPEDNKLRLYSAYRLDADTYQTIKAAGFSWAPKQQLFVAPMWTPAREDLLISLCGWIEAEGTTLAERAEERADRFAEYRSNRTADANAASAAVAAIARQFEGGQPVILGHHSTRRGLRAKEKIDAGMRKAINLWDTAEYWKIRAAGARRHAEYKALPAVRARRIKTLQAEARKQERYKLQAQARMADASVAFCDRWLSHYANRIAYEEAVLDETGGLPADAFTLEIGGQVAAYSEWVAIQRINRKGGKIVSVSTAAPKCFSWKQSLTVPYEQIRQYMPPTPESKVAAKTPPLVNYPAEGVVEMTKAEYAALWAGYKGTRRQAAAGSTGAYRFRAAVKAGRLTQVFLTDAKTVHPPIAPLPALPACGDAAHSNERSEVGHPAPPSRQTPLLATEEASASQETEKQITAMRATLAQGGVQVHVAHQLFPTSEGVAEMMIDLAELGDGMCVLEPSAGTGVLLAAATASASSLSLTVVEINPGLCRLLTSQGYRVIEADFLSLDPLQQGQVDRVLMNPPFVDGSDIKHILHASRFVRPGGLLVAICADGPRQNAQLRPVAEGSGGEWLPLPVGSFKHAGTNVNAVLLTIRH